MDLKKLKNTQWYKQGAIAIPWFIHVPYIGSTDAIGNHEIITYKGKENVAYFDKEEELRRAKKLLEKEKKSDYIQNLIEGWKTIRQESLKLLEVKEFSELKDAEITSLLKKLSKLLLKSWGLSAHIELFDPWGEELVEKNLEKYKTKLDEDELVALTSPLEFTLIQREKIDRIKLTKEKIHEHREKYFYMENSWGKAKELSEEYFLQLLKEEEIEEDVKKIKHDLKKRKIIREKLKQKLPKELYEFLNLFSRLGEFREKRKEWVMLINHYLRKILEEISKRTKVEKEILEFAAIDEMEEMTLKKEYLEELKERKKISVYTKKDGWVYGKKAKAIIETLEKSFESHEIRGNTASKGYARGKARIIRTEGDFSRVNKGDILVTIMTRPEHVPLMKKASAIVTDEGGITCHAAIISRELKKPCIIGTQVATRVIEDGEEIEVDANEGVVKKCST